MGTMIGEHVVYADEYGQLHEALVTQDFGGDQIEDERKALNLVFVSSADDRRDQYGTQIERPCSVVHQSQTPAHGRFWRKP